MLNKLGWTQLRGDALLVSDQTNYNIGLNTDSAIRLASFLYYLPNDSRFQQCGTSMYHPCDPDFICKGDRHQQFEPIVRERLILFTPNMLVVFV